MTASASSFAHQTSQRSPAAGAAALPAAAARLAATTQLVTMAFIALAHVAGGMRFADGSHSAIVDGLHTVTILSLLPLPFALHRVLATASPRASAAAVALAVDAIVFGAVLHALFALGTITFAAAGPLLLVAYGAFVGWLWMVGSLGVASGRLPNGRWMALLGATIVGLPIWLTWAARRLEPV